ncbi:MAG: hypothetical protein QG653_340 [Patescibacteria group bacterium]|nr:hypothetical protein [Patescibacteria group bacterium]
MLIEEEPKNTEINPDALEAMLDDDTLVVEEEVAVFGDDDEEVDEIDIAFQANDEGYW